MTDGPGPTVSNRQTRRVLFLCAGNLCRSPMAEALFRRAVEQHPGLPGIEVRSAGTMAVEGERPCAPAIAVMRERYGLDISEHRAEQLAPGTEADLILTMDGATERLASIIGVKGQLKMLGDFAGTGERVPDPWGNPLPVFEQCADQVHRLVEAAAERLTEVWGAGADETPVLP